MQGRGHATADTRIGPGTSTSNEAGRVRLAGEPDRVRQAAGQCYGCALGGYGLSGGHDARYDVVRLRWGTAGFLSYQGMLSSGWARCRFFGPAYRLHSVTDFNFSIDAAQVGFYGGDADK